MGQLASTDADLRVGIHPAAEQEIGKFTKTEREIARVWANTWYLTRAGQITVGGSNYNYFLAKPTAANEVALGISRELVITFSNYSNFEARSLEAYEAICSRVSDVRIERICYVLISNCSRIQERLFEFLSNKESQVVVPFYYEEFKKNRADPHFIRNRFRDSFKSRDLFDYSDPLKKDFYFFGRNEIVIDIIDKHRQNLNAGLFGLRKTGKTSIIYDVIRKASPDETIAVLVDCQNTSFNMRRWNTALHYVVRLAAEKAGIEITAESAYTEVEAGALFLKDITKIYRCTSKSILLLFDEIENITFDKSAVSHWKDGLDFVYFWQSIRSAYQNSEERLFTFCILGTNAKCVEEALIHGADNPIFNIFQPKYIPGFSVQQTREMVRKLGRLMGLKFEETIFSKLTEDYGGHPFLVRRVCSLIAQTYPERPVTIDRIKYIETRDRFNRESDYFKMLLEVLQQFYPTEYEMLEMLATEDLDNFEFFANGDYSFVKHLIGYGVVQEVDSKYDFKIDAIKIYLQRVSQYKKETQTDQEKWSEICTARGALEIRLRTMVRKVLRIAYKSESQAKTAVVDKLYKGSAKYNNISYKDLFDSRKSDIYFLGLTKLINSNWEYFSDYFGAQDLFVRAMDVVNNEGRFDAHATPPTGHEMVIIRSSIELIERGINKFDEE